MESTSSGAALYLAPTGGTATAGHAARALVQEHVGERPLAGGDRGGGATGTSSARRGPLGTLRRTQSTGAIPRLGDGDAAPRREGGGGATGEEPQASPCGKRAVSPQPSFASKCANTAEEGWRGAPARERRAAPTVEERMQQPFVDFSELAEELVLRFGPPTIDAVQKLLGVDTLGKSAWDCGSGTEGDGDRGELRRNRSTPDFVGSSAIDAAPSTPAGTGSAKHPWDQYTRLMVESEQEHGELLMPPGMYVAGGGINDPVTLARQEAGLEPDTTVVSMSMRVVMQQQQQQQQK